MKFGCGCSQITYEPFEFKISDCKPQTCSNCKLLPNTIDSNLNELKNKIICDFQNVVKQLECGIQPDIELILEEISLIYINNCLSANSDINRILKLDNCDKYNTIKHS